MADVDHPKTHVEDQDIDLPREQPVSPKHEGIDPLTESDTMYPREDVKGDAEKLNAKDEKAAAKRSAAGENPDDVQRSDAVLPETEQGDEAPVDDGATDAKSSSSK